jgi:NADH dehydrogenase
MTARTVITGANGAVGQAMVRLALAEQLPIVAAVRSQRAAASLPSLPEGLGEVAQIAYDQPGTLEAAFRDATSLIHLPGLLIERPGSSYEAANVETTRVAVDAARRADLKKIVLVSAVGADPSAANRFFRTKGEAETLVSGSGLNYTILRPPLVLGEGTEGSHAILRHARRRSVWLLGGGHHRQQPLDVDDLARGSLRAARCPEVASHRTLDLVGPVCLPDREIVERVAGMLGHSIRIFSVPIGLVRWLLGIRTRLFGAGFSPEVIDVMTADTEIDAEAAARELGISLTLLDTTLRRSLTVSGGP